MLAGSGVAQVKYGYLYNWYVTQGTGRASLIPNDMENNGWHVPLIVGDIVNSLENVISRVDFGKTKSSGIDSFMPKILDRTICPTSSVK